MLDNLNQREGGGRDNSKSWVAQTGPLCDIDRIHTSEQTEIWLWVRNVMATSKRVGKST